MEREHLVVACNTATAEAIDALRTAHPDIPVVGVEPGIKPAAHNTQSGKIAVLATAATAKSQRLALLIARHAPQKTVHIIPCHGWATEVEALNLNAPSVIADIKEHHCRSWRSHTTTTAFTRFTSRHSRRWRWTLPATWKRL